MKNLYSEVPAFIICTYRRLMKLKSLLDEICRCIACYIDEVIEAYKLIDEHPEKVIKLGVRYD